MFRVCGIGAGGIEGFCTSPGVLRNYTSRESQIFLRVNMLPKQSLSTHAMGYWGSSLQVMELWILGI